MKERNLAQISAPQRFKLIEEDILEMSDFPQVDLVFHQAAQAGVRASWGKDFEVYIRNNVLATQKLLEFYKEKSIRKFIYASSSSVYGDSKLPMKENMGVKPASPYGVTKLAGENLCYLYYRNYGTPAICLRYFTVYGPRQRPDMAIYKFTQSILKDRELTVFGDGEQTRDFTFIDDVVEANIRATRSNITGEVFNIGGGSRITVNELIRVLGGKLGKNASIQYVSAQKGDVNHTWSDISRASRWLGWKPKFNITDGLEKYVEWVASENVIQ